MTSNSESNLSKVTEMDFMDIQMLLTGLHNWRESQSMETFYDPTNGRFPNPLESHSQIGNQFHTEPLTSARHFELFDKMMEDFDGTLFKNPEEIEPDSANRIRERFQKLGVEHFLDDGVIEKEELLIASSEAGKAVMMGEDGENYKPGEEGLQASRNLLAKHGIDDPDGSIAEGLATQSEYISQKANEGLGMVPDLEPALSSDQRQKDPEASVSMPSPNAF